MAASNSQGGAIGPNMSRAAAAAAESAEMASASVVPDSVGRMEARFASNLYAALVAVVRSHSALPLTLRICGDCGPERCPATPAQRPPSHTRSVAGRKPAAGRRWPSRRGSGPVVDLADASAGRQPQGTWPGVAPGAQRP